MAVSVPVKLLLESEGHNITLETREGNTYSGKLVETVENMNCQLSGVRVTFSDGRVAEMQNVYIRGSKIRYVILPDMLKNAPLFKRACPKKREESFRDYAKATFDYCKARIAERP